jgi:hypothetical protein
MRRVMIELTDEQVSRLEYFAGYADYIHSTRYRDVLDIKRVLYEIIAEAIEARDSEIMKFEDEISELK